MITVQQQDLLHALKAVKGTMVKNNLNPILNTVHLVANNNSIEITATDCSTHAQAKIEALVSEDMDICVNMDKFDTIVNALDNNFIKMNLTDNQLEVKQGRTVFNILVLDSNEYPTVSFETSDNKVEIDAHTFVNCINKVIVSVAPEFNNLLSGVCITFNKTNIEFGGCDGNRLGVVNIEYPTEIDGQWIIPAKTLANVIKFAIDNVTLYFTDKRVTFKVGNILYSTALLLGQYPAYKQLIPTEFKSKAIIKKMPLIKAIEKTVIMADLKKNKVGLSFKDNELTVSTSDNEVGNAEDIIDVDYTGEQTIYFNPNFLLNGLKTMETDTITVCMNSPASATIILGDYKYLIMPIQVR